MAYDNVHDHLTDEGKARLSGCETSEEMSELLQEEGRELPDENLEGVAGGGDVPEELLNKVPGKYIIKGIVK